MVHVRILSDAQVKLVVRERGSQQRDSMGDGALNHEQETKGVLITTLHMCQAETAGLQ